jgi:hypothetical protein
MCKLVLPRAVPDVGRCRIVAPTKYPVEVRQVIESKFESDCANRTARMEWVTQNTMSPRQALAENKFRVGAATILEQLVQIAHCHAVAHCDHRGVQIAILEVGDDVGLDRCEPRRTHRSGGFLAVAVSPKRQCNKIVKVVDNEAAGTAVTAVLSFGSVG